MATKKDSGPSRIVIGGMHIADARAWFVGGKRPHLRIQSSVLPPGAIPLSGYACVVDFGKFRYTFFGRPNGERSLEAAVILTSVCDVIPEPLGAAPAQLGGSKSHPDESSRHDVWQPEQAGGS